jgi:hypothetical protein
LEPDVAFFVTRPRFEEILAVRIGGGRRRLWGSGGLRDAAMLVDVVPFFD